MPSSLTSDEMPFRQADKSPDQRVEDLLSRLSLDEKIGLMATRQEGIPRLGIAEFHIGGEAAHGLVAREGPSTVFPQTAGLACSWDAPLLERIGQLIAREARAWSQLRGGSGGLALWAPTVDLMRDPRWGRAEEGYSEDPILAGQLAAALVRGMAGSDPFRLDTIPTPKHFYANNNERNRERCSVSLDARNRREYYLRAFEPLIREAGAASVMTAYNAVNGHPAMAHPDIQDILKDEWRMDGFVVCDGGALTLAWKEHGLGRTPAETVSKAVKAGVDCLTDESEFVQKALRRALKKGLLGEADLDRALRRVLRARLRLGHFDTQQSQSERRAPETLLNDPASRVLAREAAIKSIVLLKNEAPSGAHEALLPLDEKNSGMVALIGPLSDEVYRDWYTGNPAYRISPLQGLVDRLGPQRVRHEHGDDLVSIQSLATGQYFGVKSWNDGQLVANRPHPEACDLFRRSDWGVDNLSFKSMANGNYLSTNDRQIGANAPDIWGWFVRERWAVPLTKSGSSLLRSWNGQVARLDRSQELRLNRSLLGGRPARLNIRTESDGIARAVALARQAGTAVVCIGNHPLLGAKETIDRPDMQLPAAQENLALAVAAAQPRTVIIIIGSYPFSIGKLKEKSAAIIFAPHGGQEAGSALAAVLFGDANPAGRLPLTWYRSAADLPDIMDYDIIHGKRSYRFFDQPVLWPFGHGLSYGRFRYRELELDHDSLDCRSPEARLQLSVMVENESRRAGQEVVQVYLSCRSSGVIRPRLELAAFRRVDLAAGAAARLDFALDGRSFAFWNVRNNNWQTETGLWQIQIGSSSADIRLETPLLIHGDELLPRNPLRAIPAESFDDWSGYPAGFSMVPGPEKGSSVCLDRPDRVDPAVPPAWLLYQDLDFGLSTHEIQACCLRVSRPAPSKYSRRATRSGIPLNAAYPHVEIRLDGPGGEILATLDPGRLPRNTPIPREVALDIKPHQTLCKICLVIHGPLVIHDFRFD